MHAEYDSVVANASDCMSMTLQYCIQTNTYIIKLFPLSGRGTTLVFPTATTVTKLQGELLHLGN